MGRQIIFFLLASLALAFFLKDAPNEYLEIWFELKAAGKVTIEDYDATWARFMLPKIALYLLVVSPGIIAFSLFSERSSKGHP